VIFHDYFDGIDYTVASDTLIAIEVIRGTGGDDYIQGPATLPGGQAGMLLYGGFGADTLYGSPGADTLYGGVGADVLADFGNTLGPGADRLEGGLGEDTYTVTNSATVIFEPSNGGYDWVLASVDYTLSDWVDALQLAPSVAAAVRGTGNAQDNTIEGNVAANILTGLAGIDYISGGDAADSLYGGAGNDVLSGDRGNDSLSGGNQDDVLQGGDGADRLLGGSGNDSLYGDNGADTLQGGAGADVMTGGNGPDLFLFARGDTGTGTGRDIIAGFESGRDVLDLHRLAAGQVFIDGQRFHGVAGEIRYAKGILAGDTDGDGTADYQIVLAGSPLLVADDLLL